jgi:hypothetical protein
MRYLALLLLAPVLLVLAALYWFGPPGRRGGAARRMYDLVVLSLAVATGVWLAMAGFDSVPEQAMDALGRASGGIWKQVLPALYGYGAFSGVLALGLLGRWRLFCRPRG